MANVSVGKDNNTAYDLSLFEPQEDSDGLKKKKNSNLIKLNAKKNAKAQRRKRNPLMVASIGMLTAIVASVSGMIVYNNVMLNELTQEITQAQQTITNQNDLAAEYQMRIDNKLTPSVVKTYAEENLGMTQIKSAQKQFISLSDSDIGEVIKDNDSDTVLESLAKLFSGS